MRPEEVSITYLSALEPDDASVLHGWRSDSEIRDGALAYPFPTSIEAERSWISRQQPNGGAPSDVCLAIRSAEGALLGYVQLRGIDWIGRTAEFGIVIGQHRGRGVGQRAMELCMRYAGEQLGLRRLWLRVVAFNASAISLYQRNGFQHEGTLRSHVFRCGSFHDVEIYGIELPSSGRVNATQVTA